MEPIVIKKEQWRGHTVILKQSRKKTVHSPFFLVFDGKCHYAPKGTASTLDEAIKWAQKKCLDLHST